MKRFAQLIIAMWLLFPGTTLAQAMPDASPLPSIVSRGLFPHSDEIGEGWRQSENRRLDITDTAFRAGRTAVFLGPNGSTITMLIFLHDRDAEASTAAWANGIRIYERMRDDLFSDDTAITTELLGSQPAWAQLSQRSSSQNRWTGQPLGLGIYGIEDQYIAILEVTGAIDNTITGGYSGVSAVDYGAMMVANAIQSQP